MKIIHSKIFYFFLGLLLAVAIPGVYAWNSNVGSGDPLTSNMWNSLVSEVEDIRDGQFDVYRVSELCDPGEEIGSSGFCRAQCDSGDTVLGGGGRCFADAGKMLAGVPYGSHQEVEQVFVVVCDTGDEGRIRATALCKRN